MNLNLYGCKWLRYDKWVMEYLYYDYFAHTDNTISFKDLIPVRFP